MATQPSAANDAEFRKLDANADHALSRDEAASNQALVSQWGTLDGNGNDQIEEAEFAKFELAAPEAAMASPTETTPSTTPAESTEPAGAAPPAESTPPASTTPEAGPTPGSSEPAQPPAAPPGY